MKKTWAFMQHKIRFRVVSNGLLPSGPQDARLRSPEAYDFHLFGCASVDEFESFRQEPKDPRTHWQKSETCLVFWSLKI